MALFEAERQEPLTGATWDEGRARAAIAAIVADAHGGFTEEGLWPIHPFDRSDERPPDCLKPLYHGAAGVIWALNHLVAIGAASAERDYRPAARTLVQRSRDDLDKYAGVASYMGHEQAAFLVGETGLLLLQWTLEPSDTLADRLEASITATVGDPRGLVWGGAGATLTALTLHERTGHARWKTLILKHFDALWEQWTDGDASDRWLWTQDLYGISERRLGALHGFAANALPMLRSAPPDRAAETLRRIRKTVRATAVREGDFANWPVSDGGGPLFLQHCNGAPGFITTLAATPSGEDADLDTLLLQAGELVWHAGPPVKFPSLCHGAAGSGYAFLKLYARTGDERWLDRARRFAVHAIDQARRDRYGQRKYSLWTGDLGLAVYLADCIEGVGRIPLLEVF